MIFQLYNLGIPVVGESIYKIKNKRHVKKVNIFSKPNTSKVRDSGPECQAATAQERPGGATQARGQGRRPGGATRGAVAEQAQEGLEELSQVEGQERRR